MNNFTNQIQEFELDFLINEKELLLANIVVENDNSNQKFVLKPYESRIYNLK